MKVNTKYLLLIFLALLPTYVIRFKIPFLNLPTTLLEILFLILVLIWLWGHTRGHTWCQARCLTPIWLFGLAGVVAIFVSPDKLAALGLFKAYIVEPIILFFVTADLLKTTQDKIKAIISLGIGGLAIGLISIFQKFTGLGIPAPWQAEVTRRVTAIYGFPNAVALFAAPIAIMAAAGLVYSFQNKKSTLKIFFITVLISTISATMLAVSDGGLIAMVAGLSAMGLMLKKTRTYTIGVIVLGIMLILAVPKLKARALDAVTFSKWSGQTRLITYSETWTMLKDRPVFGAGLAGYPKIFAPYHQATYLEIFQYPHNILLNFWSELGLLGVFSFGWLMVIMFKNGWLMLKAENSWLGLLLIGFVVEQLTHGLVDVPYFKNDLAMLFWLVLALSQTKTLPLSTQTRQVADLVV